jgi:hypothetical protein
MPVNNDVSVANLNAVPVLLNNEILSVAVNLLVNVLLRLVVYLVKEFEVFNILTDELRNDVVIGYVYKATAVLLTVLYLYLISNPIISCSL